MHNASAALTRHFCSAARSPARAPTTAPPAAASTSCRRRSRSRTPALSGTDPHRPGHQLGLAALLHAAQSGQRRRQPAHAGRLRERRGHFGTAPAYSGSSTGIAASSTAERDCTVAHAGSCSEHLRLVDNPSNTQPWAVRFLSGSGTPSANTSVARNGKLGFWVYVAGGGFSVGLGVDDSDGTERSTLRAVPADTWTWVGMEPRRCGRLERLGRRQRRDHRRERHAGRDLARTRAHDLHRERVPGRGALDAELIANGPATAAGARAGRLTRRGPGSACSRDRKSCP